MLGCKRLQTVVKVPAGALRPTRGSPCHRSNLPHSCLELSLLLLAFRRARRAGQAFDASMIGLLAVPERFVRELCRSGGANGVQRWCRRGHWEAGE